MRLLLTRPRSDDDRLETMLAAGGHEVIHEPLLAIEVLPLAPIDAAQLQAVVATSSNALRALSPNASLAALPLYAVGSATARMARERGFNAIIEGMAGAREMAETLVARLRPGRGAILYLRGQIIAFDLEAHLHDAGFSVESRKSYRAAPSTGLSAQTIARLANGVLDGVILLSPRTAEIYLQLARQAGMLERLHGLEHFCLSNRVAAPLAMVGITQVHVPAQPSLQELVALIGLSATHSGPSA